jgi:caffeoyl-CoA O-methyltransferase
MASTTTEVVAQEQQTNGNGLQKMRHSEVGHKSLLKTDDQTCT